MRFLTIREKCSMLFPDEKVSESRWPCVIFIIIVILILLPSILIAISRGIWLPRQKEIESNNSPENADFISIPVKIEAFLDAGDVDRFNFSVSHTIAAEIKVISPGNEEDVQIILTGPKNYTSEHSVIEGELDPGNYMITIYSRNSASYSYSLIVRSTWDPYWIIYGVIGIVGAILLLAGYRRFARFYKVKLLKRRRRFSQLQMGFYRKIREYLALRRELGRCPTIKELEDANISLALLKEGIENGWLTPAMPPDPGEIDSMLGKVLARGISPRFESFVLDGDIPVPLALKFAWLLNNPSAKFSRLKYSDLHKAINLVLQHSSLIYVIELSAASGLGPHTIKNAAETINQELKHVTISPREIPRVDGWSRVIIHSGLSLREMVSTGKIPVEAAVKVIAAMLHWDEIIDHVPINPQKVEECIPLLKKKLSFIEIMKSLDVGFLTATRVISEASRKVGIKMPLPPKPEVEKYEIIFPKSATDLYYIKKEILSL